MKGEIAQVSPSEGLAQEVLMRVTTMKGSTQQVPA
jgi:hypothetical protein